MKKITLKPQWIVIYVAFSLVVCGSAGHTPKLSSEERDMLIVESRLKQYHGAKILTLIGDPYALGYQHGYFLRSEIHEQWKHIMKYAESQLPIPIINHIYIGLRLDWAYWKMRRYIPADYKEEMRGLAEGAGIPLRNVHRAHAIPDLFPMLCANGVYYGRAVADGKLYHLRNLDWSREMGIHNYPIVFVMKPTGKNSFVNLGYAGFIGVLSGINENGLSVGQVGSDTVDFTLKGEPMPFILRRVLEESQSLEDAATIVKNAKRTYGYNYVFGDALNKRAVALETTATQFSVFLTNDPKEKASGYGLILEDVLIRSDTAFDTRIRSLQTASGGNPETPELEPPTGRAYETRYKKQAELAQMNYSKLNQTSLIEIARKIAPGSNIQSVIFGYPDIWVANAVGNARAAESKYVRLNVKNLLDN